MSWRARWYDMDGNEISIAEADRLLLDRDARRVALTDDEPWGSVSTVLLSLDHGFGGGPPLIFESMVFDPDGDVQGCLRTPNKVAALAAHDQLVAQARHAWKASSGS